jgi:hypothetical protein
VRVPNPVLTPGAVVPKITLQTICTTKWGLDHRFVTVNMRRHVLAAYGVAWADRDQVELDHLIPRSIGGADDILNLWPQPWADAHRKDVREVALWRAVCKGTITLAAAQAEMRGWVP